MKNVPNTCDDLLKIIKSINLLYNMDENAAARLSNTIYNKHYDEIELLKNENIEVFNFIDNMLWNNSLQISTLSTPDCVPCDSSSSSSEESSSSSNPGSSCSPCAAEPPPFNASGGVGGTCFAKVCCSSSSSSSSSSSGSSSSSSDDDPSSSSSNDDDEDDNGSVSPAIQISPYELKSILKLIN